MGSRAVCYPPVNVMDHLLVLTPAHIFPANTDAEMISSGLDFLEKIEIWLVGRSKDPLSVHRSMRVGLPSTAINLEFMCTKVVL